MEGLYLNNDNNSNKEEKNNLRLDEIWKDFPLCSRIVSNYQINLWCKEHLCNKINVESKDDLINTTKLLLEKYGNKNDKKTNNILITELMELFRWTTEISNNNNSDVNIENKKGSDNKLINLSNYIKKDLSK